MAYFGDKKKEITTDIYQFLFRKRNCPKPLVISSFTLKYGVQEKRIVEICNQLVTMGTIVEETDTLLLNKSQTELSRRYEAIVNRFSKLSKLEQESIEREIFGYGREPDTSILYMGFVYTKEFVDKLDELVTKEIQLEKERKARLEKDLKKK